MQKVFRTNNVIRGGAQVRNACSCHANDNTEAMVDALIASGEYSEDDRAALTAMRPEALQALHDKLDDAPRDPRGNSRIVFHDASDIELPYTMNDALVDAGKMSPARRDAMKEAQRPRQNATYKPREFSAGSYADMLPTGTLDAINAKRAAPATHVDDDDDLSDMLPPSTKDAIMRRR